MPNPIVVAGPEGASAEAIVWADLAALVAGAADFIAAEAKEAIQNFRGLSQERKLPSAPARPLVYMPMQDRPQPRRDAGRENGMAVFVGRLRECPVLDLKFVACGHNTIRGAAGAAILNAEVLAVLGKFDFRSFPAMHSASELVTV